jgi:hypothetical protein
MYFCAFFLPYRSFTKRDFFTMGLKRLCIYNTKSFVKYNSFIRPLLAKNFVNVFGAN